MIRKAKREKRDLHFYLNQGLEAPSVEEVAHLKAMIKEERIQGKGEGQGGVAFDLWKANYAQHCFAFHFNPEGCSRERTCAFLHADSQRVDEEAVAFG
jgi:hypothetical protein